MQTVQLDWQQSLGLSAGLAVASLTARRPANRVGSAAAAYLQESAIIAALYSVWQLAGSLSSAHDPGMALARGRHILQFEHRLGLASELDLQHLIDGHRLIEQACNLYYATVHFFALGALLVWLFARHRDRYAQIRLVIVLVTLSCLLIQLIPVAPPRLLPGAGFIDTAATLGQSVYAIAGISADQLSAMPSVHVAWALLVAWGVITVSTSRWRWSVLAHPVVTVFVVVATANHFWLDGIVAAALLVAAIVLTEVGWRLGHRGRYRDVGHASLTVRGGHDDTEHDRGGHDRGGHDPAREDSFAGDG